MSSPWLTVAHRLEGERRLPGHRDNPNILTMFRLAGSPQPNDEVAWCAAFVGACLRLSGYAHKRTLLAAEYVNFGEECEAKPGAIVVFWPTKGVRASGHVGFVESIHGEMIHVLGGNQGGSESVVRISARPVSQVRAYRWPVETAPLPEDTGGLPTILDIAQNEAPDHLRGGAGRYDPDHWEPRPVSEPWDLSHEDAFDKVQAIIDRKEGGFRLSADENGGACKFGVSRDTLASWRGRSVSIDDVRDLGLAEAHEIYRARFWKKTGADRLPAPVALLVHNLGVLGGPARAVTMLQRALVRLGASVAVDGGFGPQTLAAAQRFEPRRIVDAFVDLQREFHRSSSKTRYVAGWLSRLDEIEKIARSWIEEGGIEEGRIDQGRIDGEPTRDDDDGVRTSPGDDSGEASEGLTVGATGARVRALQEALKKAGYPIGPIDGIFGRFTLAGVLAFQIDNGLSTTGVADSATLIKLESGARRPVSSDRIGPEVEQKLRADGSRIINGADNVKTAGLLSTLLGALGLGNSAAVGFADQLAPAAGAAAKSGADPRRLIEALDKVLAMSKTAGKTAASKGEKAQEVQDLIAAIKDLQGSALDKALPPEVLERLNIYKKALVSNGDAGKDVIAQFFDQLPAVKPHIGTVFDLLPSLFQDGTLQTLSKGAALALGGLTPGVGGSLLALGIGLAVRRFAGGIIDARVDDHRSGAHLGR